LVPKPYNNSHSAFPSEVIVRASLPSLRSTLLASLLACGDGTGPDAIPVCTAPLVVTATESVTPVVTWAGGCRVNQVVVSEGAPSFDLVWAAFYADSNPIVPPVQYGVLPTGAQQLPDVPRPLDPGTTYIIDVSIADTSNGSIVFVGSDTIVP
jgi:hypothetical protein